MKALDWAPSETEIVLANGNPPPLVRYDANRPEPEFLFEVVDDFIVRKTVGAKEVKLTKLLYDRLMQFTATQPGTGQAFQELGYDFDDGGPRRKPDVSFLSEARWPAALEFPPGDFVPVAPELAVEVISPHELAHVMFSKLEQYFRGGVIAVWLVVPHTQRVYCFDSPTSIRVLTAVDDLTGDPVVPGFRMPLTVLYPPSAQP